MTTARDRRPEQYRLNADDFQYICTLVYDSTGIVLDERKREMVYRRLMRRTRSLNLDSFADYCELLKTDALELPNFTNAITTNLTSFFREPHHFEYLREQYIPKIMSDTGQSPDKRFRIWSSACSTGEEAYSTAISVAQAFGGAQKSWDVRILATDLDTQVIETAKAGVYDEKRIEELSEKVKRRWFCRGSGENDSLVKVDSLLRDMITFKTLNLMHSWPFEGPFDIIFCRNVMIYFDKKTQEKLLPRYYDLLKPGGIIFLGHSEAMPKGFDKFKFLGKTIFQRPC